MKIFTKQGITQKIILTIIIVTLCNFIFPTYSRAGIGGILFDPITDLVTTVGDSILAILQNFLYNGEYNVVSGLASIMLKAGFFVNNRDKYPDMAYTGNTSWSEEEAKENGVAVIDEENFDQISLYDAATFLVSPIVGGVALVADLTFVKNYIIPTVQYSVDKIFAGKVPAFDINFIQPKDWGNDEQNNISITRQLNDVISAWYVALRNLAIVILLSVLVYTGIRIVISSSVDDRAKYKQRLMDWLVAMCLIFFMHYIMAFILSIIDILNDTIGDTATSIPVWITGSNIQYNTDLMGLIRLQVQYKDFTPKLIYTIFYIALLVYTCKFSWIYLKRSVTMAFLTIIAPLVAMTYPIDKMNDGKAQAFNAWLKEYIFTALLQPFHLIVYTVLVGSAMNIGVKNPLYAIMVIAFIGPAEKMLRKFFGFDKASTPGVLSQAGAMFGGAAAWNMVKKGVGFIADKRGGGKSGSGGNNSVRTKGGNAVEDKNAPDGYDAFANGNHRNLGARGESALDNSNHRNLGTRGESTSDNSNTQDTGDDYSNRAFLPPEVDNTQTQDPDNWDNNDMYLNPQNYSDDFSSAEGISNNTPNNQEQETIESTRNSMRMPKNLLVTPIGRGAGRSIKNFASRKFANGRWKGTAVSAAKKAAKFAGKVAVAGAVGAIGVGVGIAGDDLEDVLKYGAAGGALGYSIAPGMGGRIANSRLTQDISASMGEAIHGSTNAAEVVAQTNKLYESGELRDWAQETFLDKEGNKPTGQKLNELEDRAIGHYNDGFTDKGDIKKVMKLEDKMRKELQENLSAEEANEQAKVMSETIGKIAKDIEPGKLSNSNYVNGKVQEFEKGISKSNPELSNDEVKANATQMMNYIMQYYKKP